MAKLIYSAIASADGYVEDADGSFDWAAPDEELLRFVNELERPIGTYLDGCGCTRRGKRCSAKGRQISRATARFSCGAAWCSRRRGDGLTRVTSVTRSMLPGVMSRAIAARA